VQDGDELQTSRFITVEPDLPPPPVVAQPPDADPLNFALGTTPPPPRARAVTVPIRNVTPPPRVIPIEQLPAAPPVAVTPPPVVLPPRPVRSAIGTETSISAITPLPRGRLGMWIMLGIFAAVAVGFTAMLASPDEAARVAAADAPAPLPAPAPAPLSAAVPVPVPVPVPAPDPVPAPAPELELAPDVVTLRVTTSPPGATVVLDGTRLGTTPFVTTVPAGPREATLKVRKRRHTPRKIKVRFDEDVTWDVQLERR
jgi:hypothetical protein